MPEPYKLSSLTVYGVTVNVIESDTGVIVDVYNEEATELLHSITVWQEDLDETN